ncbi:MAG: hypothetical protein U9P80_05590, partial [Thermodesulfobacteriota bacterium]|nr:hypothetical protein [Thermodesulfobacteriota bacterium]
ITGDMRVVEDMRTAVDLWKKGNQMSGLVTLDGMILETTGIVRTNKNKDQYGQILKARTELKALKKQEISLNKARSETKCELEESQTSITRIDHRIKQMTKDARAMETDIHDLQRQARDKESSANNLKNRMDSFGKDIAAWEEMVSKAKKDIADLRKDKDLFDEKIAKMRSGVKKCDENRAFARKNLDNALASTKDQSRKLHQYRVEDASIREKIRAAEQDIENRRQETKTDLKAIDEIKAAETTIRQDLEIARGDLVTTRTELTAMESWYQGLLPQGTRINEETTSMNTGLEDLRKKTRDLDKQKNENLLESREKQIAFDMQSERMHARFGPDMPEIPPGFDPDHARHQITELQTRVEGLGQINFASIEAFEETQSRWEELHLSYQDLVMASERLKEVISDIEAKSSKEFMETFIRVRTCFNEIFTTMFDGGKAELVLEDTKNMDAGVEIIACPPFKKTKAMSLLSEGEKTLCAISFIFALFKVRPSPFCIMDEVDAPLDDANVERFNRLIRSFSPQSQFVIVTHNRQTMEMADIIYGVTFDIPGVSKAVSMDMGEPALKESQG